MAKSKVGKKILEISDGLLASLTDLVLVFLVFGYESIIDPRVGRSLHYTFVKMDRRMQQINYQSLKRSIAYARKKGWIKENLKATPEGQKRLREVFPKVDYPTGWDGNWHLVNFDIPEKIKRKRDILRLKLEDLGFGKLQNSVWISPYNFLGDVKKIIDDLNIASYVIFSISNKVGQEESRVLAENVWKISALEEGYQKFISDIMAGKNNLSKLFFSYQSIALKDPCLPKDLLPENWIGAEAKNLYLKLFKSFTGKR